VGDALGVSRLYLGSAAGVTPTTAWELSAQSYPVASAGDVNGDGYSDVIIGSPGYGNSQGRASVYYGNGAGSNLRLRQRRGDGTAPVSRLGTSDSASAFRLAGLGRSPFGRTKVKLEREVKPLGTSLNGAGTTLSSAWTDTGVAGLPFDDLVTGLS